MVRKSLLDALVAFGLSTLALAAAGCGDTAGAGPKGTGLDANVELTDREEAPPGDGTVADMLAFVDVRVTPEAGGGGTGGGAGGGDGGTSGGSSGDGGPGGMADLGTDCVDDGDCDDTFFCNGDERCLRGVCFADPRQPCADDIPCTTNFCDEESNGCDAVPDDSVCAEGQVCDPKVGCFLSIGCVVDGECDDLLPCNGAETCVDRVCRPGTPVTCDDAVECTIDTCNDDNGACGSVPDHGACLPGELCSLREGCAPRPPCVRDDECDDGIYCNGQETCDVESGLCRGGVIPPVDDAVDCTQDVCSEEAGAVTHTPRNNRCQDGVFCNGTETCHPVDGCQDGVAPNVNDGVACTADTCDEEADFIAHTPRDETCDDGLFCNGTETCDPLADCRPGEPPLANDGIGCTVDSCSEVQRRVVHQPDDLRCDDGVFCNGPEVCDGVEGCQAGDGAGLDDGLDCTDDACDEDDREIVHTPVDARCDDGAFCNGEEVCVPELGCQDGTALATDDRLDCTQDGCDEARNQVTHTPDDSACDNGLLCDGEEICDVVDGCQPGRDSPLDDRIDCTDDVCDPVTGAISHLPNHARCDNALFCDGAETCDAARGCVNGRAPLLDDGINCTNDVCDENTDQIRHDAVNARCDDALFCNGPEACDAMQGCRVGTPPVLTDNVGCTVDACDEANDRVIHTADNTRCADALFCNGVETCDAALDCRPGTPPITDDGVGCTVDACDEGNDRVNHNPDNARCADVNVCNGNETCDAVAGCRPGANAAAGTVCQPNPRNICLVGACNPTRCGDGHTDAGANPAEQCDGGANCNALCQRPAGNPIYNGRFGVVPSLVYACQDVFIGFDVVNFNASELVFSVAGNILSVSGLSVVMRQNPAPADNNFSVTGVIAGGCTETYTLAGSFTDNDHWCGVFTLTFSGGQCGLSNCSNQTVNVCGTRR